MKKTVLIVIRVVCIVGFLVCVGVLGWYWHSDRSDRAVAEALAAAHDAASAEAMEQVRAVAADLTSTVDHRYRAPCFCGVHCRTFSCRAGTQYHYVVVVDSHAYSSEQAVAPLWAPTAKSCRGQRHEGSKRGAQSIEA